MAETTWTEEGPSAPPKKTIPTWVWFCGAGCLAMLVLGAVLLALGIGFVRNATDPEKQWEAIAKILPYDERPAEMTPAWGAKLGIEQYILQDDRGYEIQLQHMTGSQASETREKMFMKDAPEFPQNMGIVKFGDVKMGIVDLQGKEVHVLRMKMEFQGLMKKVVPKEGQEKVGSMMWADVTPEGRDDLVLLQMRRTKPNPKLVPPDGPITDDELREVMKPFKIGAKH